MSNHETSVSTGDSPSFTNLLRLSDIVRAFGADGEIRLEKSANGTWAGSGTEIGFRVQAGWLTVTLRSTTGVTRIQVRWHGDLRSVQRYLGDHWEHSYADLEWRGESAGRAMPWYFMAFDGKRTHGYGVRTQPNAFCFWTADASGVSLWADVRSGGVPVELGTRVLEVCDVVCREGHEDESAFAATRAFCREMCPKPLLADHPVYGTNDWNYAYGNNSADLILGVSQLISDLSPDLDNRPYSVIDDGWSQGGLGKGPWLGNERFGNMMDVADRLADLGVRPGIWYRPLTVLDDVPDEWKMTRDPSYLDPSRPEALTIVAAHVRRLRKWGFQMLKHDFTSFDIMGRFGMSMGASLTDDGWSFADRSRTTAEIVLSLYRTIREEAGDMRIIGCNTFSHLSAGLFEVQRTGDDTSGRSWNRTRRMGVNTLAFRAAHHNTFYAVDPDIVAITEAIPWELNEQWLRLVSGSGTALFVSVEPNAMGAPQREALRKALALASKPIPVAEPLDWMNTVCPRHWNLDGTRTDFDWMDPVGAWPFGD